MRIACLVAVALLSACAGPSATLQAGVTSAEEVQRLWGPPALDLANPDGTRQLAYPRGYYSNQTFMVSVGRDGLVRDVRQVLDDDTFYKIRPGLTRDDILRLIGPPIEVHEFPRLQQTAWDYRYQDTWGYIAILSVMFDPNGVVVGRTSRRLDRGDDRNAAR